MKQIMPKVFAWMFIGLLITFGTAFFISNYEFAAQKLVNGTSLIICVVAEIALVIFLSLRIGKMSPTAARVCFLLYSIVSGITFSFVFLRYELTSVVYVFLLTSVLFGMFAFIGMFTKIDLTKIGSYLFIGLIGVILCFILNMFIRSSQLDFIISIITVLVFVGLTAYDVQKINKMYDENALPTENLAIYGALQLYLDFINIFIELLKIFGNSRD